MVVPARLPSSQRTSYKLCMTSLLEPLPHACGATLKNRFVLAPLTNLQSHADGRLSDDEYKWLTKRAEGGFGLTMTCAASVQWGGLGFPGQLGVYSDNHLEGLSRLASGLKHHGTHAVVQLHHSGMRALGAVTGIQPLCPSDNAETGARAMTRDDIRASMEAFIDAAKRCERAGFDGVELHAAHGYLLCQFFSSELNRREDEYGGSLENRARILFEIIDGVRAVTKPEFSLGVRLSPERFGLRLEDIAYIAQRLLAEERIDYLDMSLWDVSKRPNEAAHAGRTLASYFTELKRGKVRLGAAGKIATGTDAARALESGFDFVTIGRSGILHHDFPKRVAADADFKPVALPVSAAYLSDEGLGPAFLTYLRGWKDLIAD